MNNIDFTNLGGFPLEQDTLDFMQLSYGGPLGAIARLCGDKTILTGVVVTGGAVSSGWIAVNGELILFQGGALGASVVISSTPTSVTFDDGNIREAYFIKTATCGAVGDFPFSDLSRVGIVPSGLISMWSGAIGAIPSGWLLCDGTNGTPNLSGMFIAGYNAADTDYDAIGKTGGAKTFTLSQANLPPVQIDVPIPVGSTSQGQTGSGKITCGSEPNEPSPGPTLKTAALGSGVAFDKRPSFFTLAYIIKS